MEEVHQYFETLLDSLIGQEYKSVIYIFVCQKQEEQKFMRSFSIKHYPMILERAFFVQHSEYPTLPSILSEFCTEPSLLIQLSMKSQLIGNEVFRFVNSLFQEN